MNTHDGGAAFTPGPWEAKHLDRHHWVIQSTDMSRDPFGVIAKTCTPVGATVKMVEANANLIAAAPDLLEALKLCAAICAGETLSKSSLLIALTKARAAIRRATGVMG